jgi:hypothetical protein
LTDDSDNGQGQLNLDVCGSRRNRGDCNLVRNVIKKIRWVLSTFKPFKSPGIN